MKGIKGMKSMKSMKSIKSIKNFRKSPKRQERKSASIFNYDDSETNSPTRSSPALVVDPFSPPPVSKTTHNDPLVGLRPMADFNDDHVSFSDSMSIMEPFSPVGTSSSGSSSFSDTPEMLNPLTNDEFPLSPNKDAGILNKEKRAQFKKSLRKKRSTTLQETQTSSPPSEQPQPSPRLTVSTKVTILPPREDRRSPDATAFTHNGTSAVDESYVNNSLQHWDIDSSFEQSRIEFPDDPFSNAVSTTPEIREMPSTSPVASLEDILPNSSSDSEFDFPIEITNSSSTLQTSSIKQQKQQSITPTHTDENENVATSSILSYDDSRKDNLPPSISETNCKEPEPETEMKDLVSETDINDLASEPTSNNIGTTSEASHGLSKNSLTHETSDEEITVPEVILSNENVQVHINGDEVSVSSSLCESIVTATTAMPHLLALEEFLKLDPQEKEEAFMALTETATFMNEKVVQKRHLIYSMGRQVDELCQRVEDMEQKKEESMTQAKDARMKSTKLEVEIEKLRNELNALNESMKAKEVENKANEEKIVELTSTLDEMTMENAKMEESEETEKESEKERHEVETLTRAIEEKELETTGYQKKISFIMNDFKQTIVADEKEKENLRLQKDEMIQELQSLRETLEQKDLERKHDKDAIADLTLRYTTEIAKVQHAEEKKDEEVVLNEDDKEEIERQKEVMIQELKSLRAAVKDSELKSKQSEDKIADLTLKHTNEIAEIQREREEEKKSRNVENQEQQVQIQKMDQELHSLRETIELKGIEIKQYESKIVALNLQYTTEKEQVQSQNEEEKSSMSKLQVQRDEMSQEIQNLRENVKGKELEIKQLEDKIVDLTQQHTTEISQIQRERDEERCSREVEKDEQQIQGDELSAELQNLREAIEEKDYQLKLYEDKISDLTLSTTKIVQLTSDEKNSETTKDSEVVPASSDKNEHKEGNDPSLNVERLKEENNILTNRVKSLELEIENVSALLAETVASVEGNEAEINAVQVLDRNKPEGNGIMRKLNRWRAADGPAPAETPSSELAQLTRICKVHQFTVTRQRKEIFNLRATLRENENKLETMTKEAAIYEEKVSALESSFIELNEAKENDKLNDCEVEEGRSIIKIDAGYITSLESTISDKSAAVEELQNQLKLEQDRYEDAREKIEMEKYLRTQIIDLEAKIKGQELIISGLEKAYEDNKSQEKNNSLKKRRSKSHSPVGRDILLPQSWDLSESDAEEGSDLDDLKVQLEKRDAMITKLKSKLSSLQNLKQEEIGDEKRRILSLRKVNLFQEMLDASSRRLNGVLNRLEEDKNISVKIPIVPPLCDKLSLLQDYIKVSLHLLESKLSNELESLQPGQGGDLEEADGIIQERFDRTLESFRESEELFERYLEDLKEDIDHQTIKITAKDAVIENLVKSDSAKQNETESLRSELEILQSLQNYSSINVGVMTRFKECAKLEDALKEKERIIQRLNHVIEEYRAQEEIGLDSV